MIKRIVHYLLLSLVLVGLPLGCAWIAGFEELLADVAALPPRCEEWMRDPARLWRVKCPFSWWVFALFAAITAAMVVPFVRRFVKALFGGAPGGLALPVGRFPVWGRVSLAVMVGGWVLAWTRFEWFAAFQRYPYVLQWGGFIGLMNALCVKRGGRSPLTHDTRHYLVLFPVSSLFWWFFEYLNRYVWNWFYIGVPGISPLEYVIFATVCFASVLPGVVVVAEFLGTFRLFDESVYSGMARVNIRSGKSIVILSLLTLFGLTGIVFFPQFAYPFLWISPLMGFVLLQVLMKEASVLDDLADGNWGLVFRFAVAALICGFVWETWNYYSYAKWIYNVPWVERWRIWEMPILGFAGYLPFGMECAAVAAWVAPSLVVSRSRR